jgi:hypothetical protein
MKVRITKAEEPTFWYSSHIGKVFEVVTISNRYMLKDDKGPEIRCIEINDCENVNDNMAE